MGKIEKLSHRNAFYWFIIVCGKLAEKGLWDLVSGDEPRPAVIQTSTPRTHMADVCVKGSQEEKQVMLRWMQRDWEARNKIMKYLDDNLIAQVEAADSAKDAWDQLSTMYRRKHSLQQVVIEIHQMLVLLVMICCRALAQQLEPMICNKDWQHARAMWHGESEGDGSDDGACSNGGLAKSLYSSRMDGVAMVLSTQGMNVMSQKWVNMDGVAMVLSTQGMNVMSQKWVNDGFNQARWRPFYKFSCCHSACWIWQTEYKRKRKSRELALTVVMFQGFNWESWRNPCWHDAIQVPKDLAKATVTDVWLPPRSHSVAPQGYMLRRCGDVSKYGNAKKLKQLIYEFHAQKARCIADIETYLCGLKACCSIGNLDNDRKVHAQFAKHRIGHAETGQTDHAFNSNEEMQQDIFVGSMLADVYVKCGHLKEAQGIFDETPLRNVVIWTTLLGRYGEHSFGQEALQLFEQMQLESMSPNAFTFVCRLKAWSSIGAIDKGQQLRSVVVKEDSESHILVGNILIDIYVKCGSFSELQKVFDKLSVCNVMSWNFFAGCAENGLAVESLKCLEQMQVEDNLSNDSMAFVDNARAFVATKQEKHNKDIFHLVAHFLKWLVLFLACGSRHAVKRFAIENARCSPMTMESFGFVDLYEHMYGRDVEMGSESSTVISSSLISMKGKCRMLKEARNIFDKSMIRDVMSWTALIGEYVSKGFGKDGSARGTGFSMALAADLNECKCHVIISDDVAIEKAPMLEALGVETGKDLVSIDCITKGVIWCYWDTEGQMHNTHPEQQQAVHNKGVEGFQPSQGKHDRASSGSYIGCATNVVSSLAGKAKGRQFIMCQEMKTMEMSGIRHLLISRVQCWLMLIRCLLIRWLLMRIKVMFLTLTLGCESGLIYGQGDATAKEKMYVTTLGHGHGDSSREESNAGKDNLVRAKVVDLREEKYEGQKGEKRDMIASNAPSPVTEGFVEVCSELFLGSTAKMKKRARLGRSFGKHFVEHRGHEGHEIVDLVAGISSNTLTFLSVVKACKNKQVLDRGGEMNSEVTQSGLNMKNQGITPDSITFMKAENVFNTMEVQSIAPCNTLVAHDCACDHTREKSQTVFCFCCKGEWSGGWSSRKQKTINIAISACKSEFMGIWLRCLPMHSPGYLSMIQEPDIVGAIRNIKGNQIAYCVLSLTIAISACKSEFMGIWLRSLPMHSPGYLAKTGTRHSRSNQK